MPPLIYNDKHVTRFGTTNLTDDTSECFNNDVLLLS